MPATLKKEHREPSNLGLALSEAGVRTAAQKLDKVCRDAWIHRPGVNMGGARRKWVRDCISGELTYALIEEWKPHLLAGAIGWALEQAEERLRAEAAAEQAAMPKGKRKTAVVLPWSAPPTDKAKEAAAQQVRERRVDRITAVLQKTAVKLSKLDTFLVNGSPIGDLTPEEALGWAESRERDARFVRLLTQGLPPGRPIRDSYRGAEVDQMYEMVEHEHEGQLALTDGR